MESKIELMKKVLSGLLEEVEEIGEQIKTKGIASKEICELCDIENKRDIVEFSSKARNVKKFENWLKEYNIISIKKGEDYPYSNTYNILTKKKVEGITTYKKVRDGYVYSLNVYDKGSFAYRGFIKDISIYNFLKEYREIQICPHFDLDNFSIRRLEYKLNVVDLFVGCEKCKNDLVNTMCDGVRYRVHYYDYHCNLLKIVFKKRLIKNSIIYDDLEYKFRPNIPDRLFYQTRKALSDYYYLNDINVLLSLKTPLERAEIPFFHVLNQDLESAIQYLKPDLFVIFGDQQKLPELLKLKISILFYNKDGMFLYDINREPEKDIKLICEQIMEDLNSYIEKERGNDHDRNISALYSIGQKLGYVPEREYSKTGLRIDLIWYDREGDIQVAIEVETSSTWKKDLISTWEVEPKLAIIVGFPKTDKVAENLMTLSLMKYVPHHVLYINKHTDHAFLFEKQEIIKYYNLNKEEEGKEEDFRII